MIKEIQDLNIINNFLKEFDTSVDSIGIYSHYLIYEFNEKIIGFLNYDLIYDRIEIEYIYVKELFRNKGIASHFLKYLIEIGLSNGCTNISLEVRESNLIAINFYKKNGFREVAKRERYYKNEDGILMIRELI